MALGVIPQGKGRTREHYFQSSGVLTPDSKRVDGLQYHVAGVTPDGVCIIEIWDSQEEMQAFFQSKVAAALADAQIEMQPSFFEVINILE